MKTEKNCTGDLEEAELLPLGRWRYGYSLEMGSLVVFSRHVRRLALFSEAILRCELREEPSGDIRLVSEHDEVLVHSVPDEFRTGSEEDEPPSPREGSPLKPVFDVDSLVRALGRCGAPVRPGRE